MMSPPHHVAEHPPPSNRRTRSFKGCVTCRRRRMKCDEKRPKCNTCQSSGLPCGGYSKAIFFDFEVAPEKGNATRFRRPVLTEEQRHRMSLEITSSVAPDRALWHIAKIDQECEETPESQSIQRVSGPFGVFRVGTGSPESVESAESIHVSTGSVSEQLPDPGVLGRGEDIVEDVDSVEEILISTAADAALGEPLSRDLAQVVDDWWVTESQWAMLPPICYTQDWWNAASQINFPDPTTMSSDPAPILGLAQTDSLLNCLPTPSDQANIPSPRTAASIQVMLDSSSDISNTIPPAVNLETPHDAVYLLKHYSTTVLQGFTPYRHSKTPWHILFIPHAKTCLAAITMGEPLPHASLCTFFGMLSTSASSLSYITGSKSWAEQGEAYKQRARNHARLMLPTAYNVPKVAKYKVVLMALLTMTQISTVTRSRDQKECYLLETEKFIRMRGLGRPKSRKIRLLHHCYVFERLLHESTFPGSINSQHRRHVRQAIQSSGAESYSYDGLSFDTLSLQNLDKQMLRLKGQEEGENDLHLKYPGVWAATQYPEIFGIPEIYIFLLSAIIRLGRWKEEAFRGSVAVGLEDYMRGAKEVEVFLLRLQHQPEGVALAPIIDPEQQHCQTILAKLSSAMQRALMIHFYRKVYDVDASTLQSHVRAVSECLKSCEALGGGAGDGSLRLIWPAYIAAVEAKDGDLKEEFTAWFAKCAKRSGLAAFEDTREDIEKIWQGREIGVS